MILSGKGMLVKRILVVILAAALLGAGGFGTGWLQARKAMQVEAVKTGHARRVILDELGQTKFEWLEQCNQAKKEIQMEAVKAGHARHVIVNELGDTKFEWLGPGDAVPPAGK